jgi:hypothetical protein
MWEGGAWLKWLVEHLPSRPEALREVSQIDYNYPHNYIYIYIYTQMLFA